jgi:Sortilin, neurotensin receptor 3,
LEHLTKGLPSGDQFRRTSLVFAPSDADVIYALAADRRNYVLGVFRSTNGGKSWREILGGRYPTERQMSYNNTIAVHPRKPGSVVWGGMKLYRTDDAGRSWRRITSPQRGKRDYVHSDHHVLLWPEDDMIVSGNDGGVAVTHDGGRSWTERSRGMATTMFYDLDVAPSDGKNFRRRHAGQRHSDRRRG